MRLSHLKFLPCAVLIVLFFLPWLELWESDSPFSDGFASASGLQMAFGWATPCDTGDVGIPAMDDENDAFLLSVASPRRWSWSLFPTARAQLMGILGVSSSHRNGGDFVAPCLALEASCVIYALLAMAGILIVLVFEKRHRAKLA